MNRDLIPAFFCKALCNANRALLFCSILGVLGMSAISMGEPTDQKATTDNSKAAAPVAVTAETELMHDAAPADQTRASLTMTEKVTVVRKTRVIQMEVTAYCACPKCCGPKAKGITASGKMVSYNSGKFVAADTSVLPFGTKLLIPGYDNKPVEVIDRGGAIKGNKLDVFYASHDEARKWGRQHIQITIVE